MSKTFPTPDWARNNSIYEVNLRQYTPEGTFRAFAASLPRLKEMGIGILWFMPVTPIAAKNRKGTLGSYYSCSDYTAINPEFGTFEDFKELVLRAHQLGFKIIIDWVANHTGWDHRWTREHPEYYKKDPATGDFRMASGMEDIIELDFSNTDMRSEMIADMKFWLTECNIDGFRCDLASWVQLDFWEQARAELEQGRSLFWLGEFDELENPSYGNVFDASYSWLWMHNTEDFYQRKGRLTDLVDLLKRYSAIGDQSMRAWFTSNHDENSWNGTEYEKYGAMAKALAVFSCTWNGVPLIYSGQEIPLRNHRLKFFEKDLIVWPVACELQDFYKKLFDLHRNNPALRGGDAEVITTLLQTNHEEAVLAYWRKKAGSELIVLLNLSGEDNMKISIQDILTPGDYLNLFTGDVFNAVNSNAIELQSWSYSVLTR